MHDLTLHVHGIMKHINKLMKPGNNLRKHMEKPQETRNKAWEKTSTRRDYKHIERAHCALRQFSIQAHEEAGGWGEVPGRRP